MVFMSLVSALLVAHFALFVVGFEMTPVCPDTSRMNLPSGNYCHYRTYTTCSSNQLCCKHRRGYRCLRPKMVRSEVVEPPPCLSNPCNYDEICIERQANCFAPPCPMTYLCERKPHRQEGPCLSNPCDCNENCLEIETSCFRTTAQPCPMTYYCEKRESEYDPCSPNPCDSSRETCVPATGNENCNGGICMPFTCIPHGIIQPPNFDACDPNPCDASRETCVPATGNENCNGGICLPFTCIPYGIIQPSDPCEPNPCNRNEKCTPNSDCLGGMCPPFKCKRKQRNNRNRKCPKNEKWSKCGSPCPDICPKAGPTCAAGLVCVKRCVCKNGYIRKSLHGKCIRKWQC